MTGSSSAEQPRDDFSHRMVSRVRHPRELGELTDAELITRYRAGHADAYGQLWSRHVRAAVAAARAFTDRMDPEDVAAEAFLNVMQALRNGRGPNFAFRPYLLTSVRNTAARTGRRAARDVPLGDTEIEDARFTEESLNAALDSTLIAKGYKSLPLRWQEVLWYMEVEGLAAADAAALMGLSATAVTSLSHRAREGLRKAWIRVHLQSAAADSECRWTLDHLPAMHRGRLRTAEDERLRAHLADCMNCQVAAEAATEAARRLALGILSAFIGVGSAGAYLGWAGHPATAAAETLPPPSPPGIRHGMSAAKKTAIAAGVAASLAALAISISWAVDNTGTRTSNGPPDTSQSTQALPVPLPTPPASSAAPATAVRSPSSSPEEPTPPPVTIRSQPAPPLSLTSHAVPLVAPVILATDTDGSRFYPVVTGTATPGATITVTANGQSYTTTADAAGDWTSPTIADLVTGLTQLSAVQAHHGATSAKATATVDLATVAVRTFGAASGGMQPVSVAGLANSTVLLRAGTACITVQLDSTGHGAGSVPDSAEQVAAYYSDGDRRGPASTSQLR